MNNNIQIICSPSILGLQSNGVERLPQVLLACGLKEKLGSSLPLINVPTLNHLRSNLRDRKTKCLNPFPIKSFSLDLNHTISSVIASNNIAFVLGGDCSILLGIGVALKSLGTYGLIFVDAHADFYEPEKSTTGEVADMDLAILTGRGPELLTNIGNYKPYLLDEHVIHIGQRDEKQAAEYGSQDIRETIIKCFSLEKIRLDGISVIIEKVLNHVNDLHVDGFWLHFDTDVLADEINPAVDYRLPGGLQFEEVELLINKLWSTGKVVGASITIYNANLDKDNRIAHEITDCLSRAFATPKSN